jgi:hypothetical protein
MEGIHLLYNHLLQEHFFPEDYDGEFENAWRDWRKELKTAMIDYNNFNPSQLLPYVKYPRPNTQKFIDDWWKLITESSPNAKPTTTIKDLLRKRELYTKGTKSRLNKPISANTDVELTKRIGLSRFQYRFYNARTIINDIINPV